MSKFNPLYVFAFFAVAALLLIARSAGLESSISEQAQKNASTQRLGKQIAALKADWKDSTVARKKIDAVLGLRSLGARVKSRERSGGTYKVVMTDLNARELDTLFSKMLNETVSVKSMKWQRNGDQNVSVTWEFEL